MKIKFIALLFGLLLSENAFATGGFYCKAVDGRNAEIGFSSGRLPVLGILGAEVTAFGKTWSTKEGAKNQIAIGQAFADGTDTRVDFTDTNINKIIISLRTLTINTEKQSATAGILKVGEAVYPVSCEIE